MTTLPTYLPSWIAGWAVPGTPSSVTMSPIANTSGWPLSVRSGSTWIRPALSSSAPLPRASSLPSSDAVTPAAQITVLAGMCRCSPSEPTVSPSASISVTGALSSTSTPRWRRSFSARLLRLWGNAPSTFGVASNSSTWALLGSISRYSPRSTRWASSAIWPASSTPVGPAPTTANVNHAWRSAGSDCCSAISNAPRMRLRTRPASSSVFIPGAIRSHSRWPKYEWVAPVATISVSYGISLVLSAIIVTIRRSRSISVTRPSSTRTFFWRRNIARSAGAT